MAGPEESRVLGPYLPRLVADWLARTPEQTHRRISGTLVFADISGFTKLTERLARKGRVGAEEMSDALDATFGELLEVAAADGADLVKWGGDAVLLLFDGPDHAARACRAAHGMRGKIRHVGHLATSAGQVTLRMSIGVHSGAFDFFLVGDPALHRELLVCGPEVNKLVELEALAHAGEIAVGLSTVSLLDGGLFGTPVGDVGRLLRRPPGAADFHQEALSAPSVDLRRAIPVPVREHLLLGGGEPEHRAIAVGFVRFSGTDDLLRTRGPEAVTAALDVCIRNISRVAEDLDVTFSESDINPDGGKVLLVAGAPTSSGHDAERLLRAARLVVDRAGVLPLRVGVNYGRVFSGDFGPTFRRTYSVKGDAINLAARLCARAEPGQILATQGVVEHSNTLFETVPLAPFSVKGKSAPVHAVELGAVSGERTSTAVTGSLMVGRLHEMTVLGEALEQARSRRGGLVQILGEAGVGKSRLMAELARLADEMTVLQVRCDEYESSTPYHPFRTLLRDVLGISAGTDRSAAVGRLTARCQGSALHLVPWLPLLGTVLGLTMEETEETSGLEEEFRKRRLDEVVTEFLHAVLPTAALIVVDDAQHMDGGSADLLTRLSRGVVAEPWLIVVSSRDEATRWTADPAAGCIELRPGPLTDEESIHLLQAATQAHPLPRPTIAALAARAAGNPLFLESLVLATDAGGSVDNLPASVEDLVTSQVDRLAPPDRVVLRYASVLGMRFEADDLAELVGSRVATLGPSTYARLSEFVEPNEDAGMRFRHALMRDVAYEGLPYRTRTLLHDQVGERLERSEVADKRGPELLSFHFFHAKRFEKAWAYSVRAGDLARAKFANQEAVNFFTRAVEAERRGPEGLVGPEELGGVFERIGDTWFTIGLPDRAADAFRRARRELSENPVRSALVVAKEAKVDLRLRRLPQSLSRVTRALRSLDGVRSRDASAARAVLAMRYAISRFSQGRVDDALRWGNRAAKEAEEAVDRAALARAYATLYGIYVATGREPDLPYGELALQAYTELEDLPGQADCMNNLAIVALDHNRWVEAADTFGRSAEVYRRIGDTAGEANAIFNQAEVLVRQGRLAEGRQLLDEVLSTARAVSDDELVALVLRELGRAVCALGEFDTGLTHLEQAREIFEKLDEPDELPATDVALSEALLQRGDLEATLRMTSHLLEGVVAADSLLHPVVRQIRGFAHLERGDRDLAATEFEAGISESEAQDNRYALAMNSLGLARAHNGDLPDEGGNEEAVATLRDLGVVSLPIPGRTTTPV